MKTVESTGKSEGNIQDLSPFKSLFWDTDVSAIDIQKYRHYIIERILELGEKTEVKWMFDHYSREQIIEVLKKSRDISDKSASFWKEVLKIEAGNAP